MGYLLDTCLLSEVWRPTPNAGVIEWLEAAVEDELHLSVLSLGELKRGIELLPEGRRKVRLVRDYVKLRSRFSSRVLPITDAVAERWGDLAAAAARAGRDAHVVDTLLASTALVHGLTLVTRNLRDVSAFAVPVVNPWT
jgi:predicted nucleic acid-binding protein